MPDLSGTYGRVDTELHQGRSGGIGGKVEGFVNLPVTSRVAARVVGWYQRNAGYIDNVAGTRSFLPQPGGITVNNAAFVRKDYNDVEIAGGRAALKIDLDDNWTIEPTVSGRTSTITAASAMTRRSATSRCSISIPSTSMTASSRRR